MVMTYPKRYDYIPVQVRGFVQAVDSIVAERNRTRKKGTRVLTFAALYKTCSWLQWMRRGEIKNPPPVAYVNALAARLKCSSEEWSRLLLAANHAPFHANLSPTEESGILAKTKMIVDYLPLPAYAIDRRWNICAWNRSAPVLFGTTYDAVARTAPHRRNILRYLFDPSLGVYHLLAQDEDRWLYTAYLNVYWFKRDNIQSTKEKWFNDLHNELASLPSNGQKFHDIWEKVKVEESPPSHDLPFPFYVTEIPIADGQIVRIRGLHIRVIDYEFPRVIAYMPDDASQIHLFAQLGLPTPGTLWPAMPND
jgi:hypothetical protein